MNDITTKVTLFGQLIELETAARMRADGHKNEDNIKNSSRITIKTGSKFIKVDVGSSGKYMVEVKTGNIFGIKSYGVVHRGHFYGTLDETAQWNWGDYYPTRKDNKLPLQKSNGCPVLTFAPVPVVTPQPAEAPTQQLVNGVLTDIPAGYRVVKSIMAPHKEVIESKDTPYGCSVADEAYWCR